MSTVFDAHKNFSITTVSTAPSPANSGTSLIVADSSVFPTTPFNATVWPTSVIATSANAEVVRVTNITGNTLTIVRIQENTSARNIVIGDQIANTISKKPFTDIEGAVNAAETNVATLQSQMTTANGNITTLQGQMTTANTNITNLQTYQQVISPFMCQGRLTLTSGSPTGGSNDNVTGATTVYFTPYKGNQIALFDGASTWNVLNFAETSIALGTLSSGKPYDVFAFNNSGTLALEILAWTNDTARATVLVFQNAIYVKSGATTRRYLGTFYTTAATTTEDSPSRRLLFNYYNRVPRRLNVSDSTASWTYTTATWRQANANAANQLDIMVGVPEDAITLVAKSVSYNDSNTLFRTVGIGRDSTTTPIQNGVTGTMHSAPNVTAVGTVNWGEVPPLGRHTYTWLEASNAAGGTTTWYGNSGADPGSVDSAGTGMFATWAN